MCCSTPPPSGATLALAIRIIYINACFLWNEIDRKICDDLIVPDDDRMWSADIQQDANHLLIITTASFDDLQGCSWYYQTTEKCWNQSNTG